MPTMAAAAAVWCLLALASAIFTRSVEAAQLTTLPLILVALGLSGLSVPLVSLPEVGQTLVQHSPMFPVVDLVYLSLGTVRVSGDVVTGAAFWSAAVMDLAVLVGWVALGLMVIRRAFRWEPRQ